MVPCRICHIYAIWDFEEVGDALKSPFQGRGGGGNPTHKWWRGQF